MVKIKEEQKQENNHWKKDNIKHVGGNGVYGLGFVGAVIYYLQHAHTFSQVIIGILKAIFWPAFLIYNLLGLLKI